MTDAEPSSKIAVYGTLRRGFDNHQRAGMHRLAFLGSCEIPGTLYDLGPYPGLTLDEEETVVGELYGVTEQDLTRIDRFEGATGPDPLYERQQVELTSPDTAAWVYEYAGSVAEADRIESGDWAVARE